MDESMGGSIATEACRPQELCDKKMIRTKKEWLQQYEIGIRFLSTGCIIRVGCKEIPFSSVSEGISELNTYVENPEESINKWNEKFKNED